MAPHATDCPLETEVGTPSAPPWEVADIFRLSGETYRRAHPVPPAHQKVMRDIEACRTAQLGGHAEHCPTCGFERYAYNSCRNRHCPKCQTFTQGAVGRGPQSRVAACALFPPGVYRAPRPQLPHPGLQAAPLDTAVQRCQPDARPVWAPQPRRADRVHHGLAYLGSDLRGAFPCPLRHRGRRAFLQRGALDRCRSPLPLSGAGLEHSLSRQVLRGVGPGRLHRRWPLPEGPPALGIPEGFAQLRDQLYAKEWVVYAKAPFAGPAHVLDYIGRYTHRVAIANHRLLDVRDGWVRFAYRNRRQGNRVQTMTLDADEFIRRFLLHVLPRGFMRLRHYGFLANRHKARTLRRCRELLGQPSEPPPRRAKSVVQWMQEVTGIDLTQCPHCGARPLIRLPLPPRSTPAASRGIPVEVPIYDSS